MAKYRRFVAYVYEYQKGKKGRNCGFIRVEAWEKRCRLEVHLYCPGLTPGVRCGVFGFIRNAGLMDGSLIGVCRTEENRADCVMETERDGVGEAKISLDQMGGMILTTENGAFFGTEWDDQPVRPENFRRMKPAGKGNENAGERKTTGGGAPPEERQDDEKIEEKEAGGQGEIKEPSGKEREEPEEGDDFQGEKEEDDGKQMEEVPDQREDNAGTPKNGGGDAENPDEGRKEKLTAQSVPETAQETQMQKPEFGEDFDPFGDGEITDCRKIRPEDFRYFCSRDCALRNNRFLQYGFYSFGHLLFGRLKTGAYVLGVPGVYDQQERFMANMFGFPYFKQSGRISVHGNKGGYWYRLVNAPKLG